VTSTWPWRGTKAHSDTTNEAQLTDRDPARRAVCRRPALVTVGDRDIERLETENARMYVPILDGLELWTRSGVVMLAGIGVVIV
jgi:hypothetical protein